MSDEAYEAFKRVVSSRKKPKIEMMIDGVSGFLFIPMGKEGPKVC